MAIENEDPYYIFELWLCSHGYQDIADCEPEDVDLSRLDQAIAEYEKEEQV